MGRMGETHINTWSWREGGDLVDLVEVVLPLVQAAAPSVHEKVGNGRELQAELVGYGDLDLFGRALVFFEDVVQSAPLVVREN